MSASNVLSSDASKGDIMTGSELSVESALEMLARPSAVGMWFHTYLDQWIEVRKPASGGKIAVTVHSETGYRQERSPLGRAENMIRTGHWVAFGSRPTESGKAASIDRMLKIKEARKVAESAKLMAKALDLLGLPDAALAVRALSKEGNREAILEACAKLAGDALESAQATSRGSVGV